jgi:hypothetical protein
MPVSTSGGSRAIYKVDRYGDGDQPKAAKDQKIKAKRRPALAAKPDNEPTIKPAAKKKPTTALTVAHVSKDTTKKVQQYEKLAETVRTVGSTFGVKRREIIEAIEKGDLDGSILGFQKQAYATIMGIIPIAEREYRKLKRESQAYALNALVGMGRELAQDLAASADRGRLAELLVSETLEPMFKAVLQHIVQQNIIMKGLLSGKVLTQHEANLTARMDDALKETAGYLQSTYQLISQQITKQITGQND